MFGATEDRARQLAGRQRWKRIGSSGSTASYRSASSSSQLSQLSHFDASSIFEQSIQRPYPIPEHHAPTTYGTHVDQHVPRRSQSLMQHNATSDVEEALSQMMASNHHPRTQQQRSQAEYLSQVLYNETAVKDALVPSSGRSVIQSLTKKYGVLGWGAKILNQSRHTTEPTPQSYAQGRQSSMLRTLETTNRSMSAAFTTTQPIVSLRGGAGDPVENFWGMVIWHIHWDLPFNTGTAYRSFVDSLSLENRKLFDEFFVDASDMSPHFNGARRAFYELNLGPEDRRAFWDAAFERAMELIGPTMRPGVTPSPEAPQRIRETSVEGDMYPLVSLDRLAIAFLGGHSFMDG